MKNSTLWAIVAVVVIIAGMGTALAYYQVQKVENVSPSPTPSPTPTVTVTPSSLSGISGVVLLGPTCPVMRDPPDPQCADKPYATTLALTTIDGTETIKTFHSNNAGKFDVAMQPGTYSIHSVSGASMLPRCGVDGPILVRAGIYSNVTVNCDTGIR